jgi:predicted nucleic acid-binding protein
MNLVDSSGWLHYFMNGPLAERFAGFLSKSREVLTPTIVLYEVYKRLKIERDQGHALNAVAQMEETNVVSLSESLAYHAANLSIEHQLAMADAIIYATADAYNAKLITSDADLKGLSRVTYISTTE